MFCYHEKSMNDTIVAISTPPGESAIGIIRLSGDKAVSIVSKLFRSVVNKSLEMLPVRYFHYGHIIDSDNIIDEVMVVVFKAPYSYTKETVVEVHTHGGIIAIREVFNILIKNGAIPAEPGEFTKRAFLNGRIDLVQAESVMDMISAKSKVGFNEALSNLNGKFSKNILAITDILTDLIAKIEVLIDYPDEDIESIALKSINLSIVEIESRIGALLETYASGKLIKDGINVSIVGRPNAGKSSLMNALLQEDRAIVTHIPGTTRDVISESISLNGMAVNIYDTAGIRETDDYVESIGIKKSRISISEADIVLYVMDLNQPLCDDDYEILELLRHKKVILILNKIDLEERLNVSEVINQFDEVTVLRCSLLSDLSAKYIEDEIVEILMSKNVHLKEGNILTNARHYNALVSARESLMKALREIELNVPLDIIQYCLHESYHHLGEITGMTIDVDVTNRIFSKFCLGK